MTGFADRPRSYSRWFWGGFFAILLLGVLAVLFAAIRSGKQWAEVTLEEAQEIPRAWTQVVRVTLAGGEALYIDPAAVPRIQEETKTWIEARRQEAQGPMFESVDRETEAIYQGALAHVPAFADWYYSLTGEYARLFYAAVGNLPEYVSGQLQTLVFDPAGTADAIERMAGSLDDRLSRELRDTALGLQALLTRLVRAEQLSGEPTNVTLQGDWALGEQLTAHLQPYVALTPGDIARQGAATSAGVGLAAVTAKKLAATTVAKTTAKMATGESVGALAAGVSKLGLKSAAKAGVLGGAGSGAASGAALCAATVVGAPMAPGCALLGGAVTGIAAWLLVDKAVLEAEELLGREAFEQELRQALAAQRDEMRATLKEQYAGVAESVFEQLENDLSGNLRPGTGAPEKTFIPARAAQEASERAKRLAQPEGG